MAPKLTAAAAQRARSVSPLVLVQTAERDAPYGRVSTDLQKESETINAQKSVLIKDITVRDDPSLPVAQQRKLVDQFWDDGVSGTIPLEKRPEGQRLVNMVCERGNIRCKGECDTPRQIDVVWATKLDRLARTLNILVEIEAFLRNHGVKLRVLEHNIDTSTPLGMLIFTILGAIGQWEREVILERTANGRRQKASEGRFVGGRRTFGLKTDENGHLVVDDSLVAGTNEMAYRIVQHIFENVAYNGSTAFREAQRWGLSDRRVGLMLHNPRYKGEGGIISGGTEWIAAEKNPPPAIVSPETWELVQTALLDNRKSSSRNRQYDYLLTRLLVCCEPFEHHPVVDDDGVTWGRPAKIRGLCGRVFAGRVEKRRNANYAYYYCSRANCTARMLRGVDAENAVWAVVEDMLRNPKKMLANAIEQRNQEETIRTIRTELSVILESLSQLDAERERVIINGERGRRTQKQVDQRLSEIETQVLPLQQQKLALEMQFRSVKKAGGVDLASLTAIDINAQLDTINALCASSDPSEVHEGRQRKAALLRSSLQHIEVRTDENRRPQLKLYLRIGTALSVDPSIFQETSGNEQHRDQNDSESEYSNVLVNGQEMAVVSVIVLAPAKMGPAKGWKQSVA